MSQTSPRIVFHIGAHKTATTHLQHSVGNVTDLLAMEGVQFFGPQSLRARGRRLEARFDLPFNPRREVADTRPAQVVLDEMLQGGERLVFSEENFIGVLFDRESDGPPHRIATPLYPHASVRLAALARRIAPDGIDLYLGLRDPAGFLNSAYGQALLAEHVVPEGRFRTQNPLSGIDWAELVARLRDTPGIGRITVWRHEDYAALFPRILTEMLGAPARHVTPIRRSVNPGLSERAVRETLDRWQAGETGPIAHAARAAHPVGPDQPAYRLYGEEDAALSRAFYDEQLRLIAQMDGVTLLRPEG